MTPVEWVLGITLTVELLMAAWWGLVVKIDPFSCHGTDW